jgi:hypothetical protein
MGAPERRHTMAESGATIQRQLCNLAIAQRLMFRSAQDESYRPQAILPPFHSPLAGHEQESGTGSPFRKSFYWWDNPLSLPSIVTFRRTSACVRVNATKDAKILVIDSTAQDN